MLKTLLGVTAIIAIVSLGTAGIEATNKRTGISHWLMVSVHPIKGNFTTYSGEPCTYHLPSQRFYRAERCYASEAEAVEDGVP
jgi:hypothetical protein